jgi:hypothetical protein
MDKEIGLATTSNDCDRFIGARREARAHIITNECKNEHDFHHAFTVLYADPHIRVTTTIRKDMLQRFVDTALNQKQVDTMKNLTLPEGVLFKDLVLALFALERRMFFVIERQTAPLPQQKDMEPPQSHPACSCFVIDDNNKLNRKWPHVWGRYYVRPMVSDDYPGFLEVDIRKNTATWHQISEAQKLAANLRTLTPPSPGSDSDAYTYDSVKQEPSTGMFVCLTEGLCAWNRKEQQYVLVFPIAALRSLFCWCRGQLSEDVKA